MAFGLGEDEIIIVLEVCTVAKGGKAVLIGAVLEQKIAGILMNLLVLGRKGDVSLEVEKCLIRVSLNLKAFGSLEVGLGVLFIKISGNS